jgi:hypothetical protein
LFTCKASASEGPVVCVVLVRVQVVYGMDYYDLKLPLHRDMSNWYLKDTKPSQNCISMNPEVLLCTV